jgi:16S rRNA G966 N2-methylase RsmD
MQCEITTVLNEIIELICERFDSNGLEIKEFSDSDMIEMQKTEQESIRTQLKSMNLPENCIPVSFTGKTVLYNPNKRHVKRKVMKCLDKGINYDTYSLSDPNPISDVDDKYWDQRYRLLSRYDKGIILDPESWYSITPEIIANHITYQFLKLSKKLKKNLRVALDCFSGSGGNSISLAKHFDCVIAVDIDEQKHYNCRHNADLYNVENRIFTITTDVNTLFDHLLVINKTQNVTSLISNEQLKYLFNLYQHHDFRTSCETNASSEKWKIIDSIIYNEQRNENALDVLFLAPPWGGPAYTQTNSFNLRTMLPSGDGFELVLGATQLCENVVLMVPRNTSHKHLKKLQNFIQKPCIVEDIYLHHKRKMIVVYIGSFFTS